MSPGQVHQNFYLSCYQITCPCQEKDKQALDFLLVRRTLGENICLSCLKFNLSWAPGQVIFYPWIYKLFQIKVGNFTWTENMQISRIHSDEITANFSYKCTLTDLSDASCMSLAVYGVSWEMSTLGSIM